MRAFLAAVLVFVLIVAWAVLHGTKVEATCGPTVSTPAVVRLLDGAEVAGRALHSLQDMYQAGPTPLEVAIFVRRVINLVGLVGDTFGAALRGEQPPKDAEGLRREAGRNQAAALAGCSCREPDKSPQTPAPDPGFDPRSLSAASLSNLSGERLARTVARRFWSGSDVRIAVAVSGAESRWNPKALSQPNYNGTRDHGLWQINTIHRDLLAAKDWRDPMANGWMAYQVWKRAGGSWRPWTTYNSGSYRKFLHDGPTAAIPEPIQPGTPAKPDCEPPPAPRVQAISSGSLANLTNRRTPSQAVAFMQAMVDRQTDDGKSRCLHWVGMAYGYPTTADNWAIHQWRNAPQRYKHPGDTSPPAGALMFWDTGSYGHVALSAGGGKVFSTDTSARDRVGLKPFSYFRGYGKYVGWTDPMFRGQTRTGAQA